ncbi:MAG: class I SAM-dependent RNA methyltransferase, partial [Geminicoccaceae bacterium]|nr:class I SAM-dependent RNA methyltransferase [Geminicoccaceae bacterium]
MEALTGDVTIEAIGDQGDGLARLDRQPISVPLTLPGDRVLVRAARRSGRAPGEILAWRSRAPRAEPPCRHFGTCGGCRLQHLDEEAYRRWVGHKVERALARHEFSGAEVRSAAITPPGSRRRMRLGFVRSGGRLRLGLRALASHRIVEVEECPIARPAIVGLFQPLRTMLGQLVVDQGEVLITETPGGLDVLLIGADQPDHAARERR